MPAPVAPVFVALDTVAVDGALAQAEAVGGLVAGVKLGLEFFAANGPAGVHAVMAAGHTVFLDLKLHDIPSTVAGAVRALTRLGPRMLTIHASGGAAMLRIAAAVAAEAAAEAELPRPLLLAVSVLTSLDDGDLVAVGQRGPIYDQVRRLADVAQGSGVDGVVCSPLEIAMLRRQCGMNFKLVTPGIRPSWAAAGDQKRVMTPAEAVALGADYLVIGRPITKAADPAGAARRIADEIAAGLG